MSSPKLGHTPMQAFEQALAESGYPLTSQFYQGISGLARKLASQYQKSDQEEDFLQVALEVACRYEKRYDPSTAATFYTYINKPIKVMIQESFGNPNRNTHSYKKIQYFVTHHMKVQGTYPDINSISLGTKLSHYEIMSIYFDRHLTESLTDEHMKLPSDPAPISEYLGVLSDSERQLLEFIIVDELSIEEASRACTMPLNRAKEVYSQSLAKVKEAYDAF